MADPDLARLRGKRLFVGTPMYDGRCCSQYASSVARLAAICAKADIQLRFHFLGHEALIAKARNIIVGDFLDSGDGHLIFIDADIGFDANDVLRLLALQADGADRDVIAAPYPLKQIVWGNVLRAARAGLADAEPERLARYAGPVTVHPAHGPTIALNAPVEVTKAGSGFMMIRRETFERFRAHHPDLAFGVSAGDGPRPHAFFETELDTRHGHIASEMRAFLAARPDATAADMRGFLDGEEAAGDYSGKHVSEDYVFCLRVRAAGMKVWLCPWMELTHTGTHTFTSRLADLAAIGAA